MDIESGQAGDVVAGTGARSNLTAGTGVAAKRPILPQSPATRATSIERFHEFD